MKAAVHDTFGEPVEVMTTTEVDTPVPGQGEVLVKMALSPVHNHDIWTVRGEYGYKPELPGAIGGSEALGTIEAVGDEVDTAMVGRRVTLSGIHCTWAEYFTAPADAALPVPDDIPDTVGAQLIAMPLSALSLLETLQAKKGEWIIQSAANGAVGKIMTVLAKSRGINLLNLVRRSEAVTELEELGIENVLSTSDDDWKNKAQELIGEEGASSAIDSVGGDLSNELVDLLGTDGELVVFGTATGAPMPLSSSALIIKHITIRGFWGSRVMAEMDPDRRNGLIKELVTLAADGELKLDEGGIYPLDEITDALSAALTPGRAGKVMLKG